MVRFTDGLSVISGFRLPPLFCQDPTQTRHKTQSASPRPQRALAGWEVLEVSADIPDPRGERKRSVAGYGSPGIHISLWPNSTRAQFFSHLDHVGDFSLEHHLCLFFQRSFLPVGAQTEPLVSPHGDAAVVL